MHAFLAALLGHILFLAIAFGGMLLLFTNLRFDLAVYASLGVVAAFFLFVYWPRR